MITGDAARAPRSTRLGLAALVLASFCMAADITITNVALPAIAADLDASMSSLQWVVDSYNIAVAGLLLLGAGIGDRYSRTWTFLGGLAVFAVGSVIAGLATSVGMLVLARTVMGIGAAGALAPAIALVTVMYAPADRAKAVAAWSAAGSLGLALSPILGGIVLSFASWHWVFLINVPLMVVAIVIGLRALPRSRADDVARLDVMGAALSSIGLGLFLGAVIEGPSLGWTSPLVIAAGVVGLLALVAFVLWELRQTRPMFEVRVLLVRGVAGASAALFGSFVAFTGTVFLVAQDIHVLRGATPFQLGCSLMPFAIAMWVVSSRAGAIARAIGQARTVTLGMLLLTGALLALGLTVSAGSLIVSVTITVIVGAGSGLVIPIASVVILNDLPPALAGSASGTSMLARFAGASAGVAALGTVLAMSLDGPAHSDPVAFADGVRNAYLAGAAILAALTLVQWLLLRRRPVPTTAAA